MREPARTALDRLSRELRQSGARGMTRDPRLGEHGAARRRITRVSWAGLAAAWKGFSGFVLSLGAVIVVGALLLLLGQQFLRKTVSIEAITVPKAVAEEGYTGEVAATRLRDAISRVVEKAALPLPGTNVELHTDLPEIVVPRLGIPLDAVATVARTLLGMRQWRSISGEFVEHDGTLWLKLRVNGKELYTAAQGVGRDRPDEALQPAALAILGATSPVVVSAWYAPSNPDLALGLAAKIIHDLPTSDLDVPWAYILASSIFENRKQEAEAERAAREAIRISPRMVIAHNNLGLFLYEQHRPSEANAELRRAIELEPGLAVAHTNLALVLNEQHKPDAAVLEARWALKLEPGLALAHNNFGFLLYGAHQLNQAVAEYRRAIEIEPDLARPHNNLGQALMDQNEPDQAIAEFRRALAIDPQIAEAHSNLGVALLNQHRVEEGEAELPARC